MYTYLSSHVYIISYTNNTYVFFKCFNESPARLLSLTPNCRTCYNSQFGGFAWVVRDFFYNNLESNKRQATICIYICIYVCAYVCVSGGVGGWGVGWGGGGWGGWGGGRGRGRGSGSGSIRRSRSGSIRRSRSIRRSGCIRRCRCIRRWRCICRCRCIRRCIRRWIHIYNGLSPIRFQVIIKNPSRPPQSHRIDYCNRLCYLVWGSAAVLEARCNIWKRTYVLFV